MAEDRPNSARTPEVSGRTKKNFHDVPLLVTVSKVKEECYRGYKEGDTFTFEDFTKTPQGFCQGIDPVIDFQLEFFKADLSNQRISIAVKPARCDTNQLMSHTNL